jgi:hypothetical protein
MPILKGISDGDERWRTRGWRWKQSSANSSLLAIAD